MGCKGFGGTNMNRRHATIIFGAACVVVAGAAIDPVPSSAQTFQSYRCADGTLFLAGFYPYDPRAYLQIDGTAVTLSKRLALSGSRYSGGGVTLKMSKAGVTVKHANRPTTACAPI
jgi:membrane-bound inhibitor of C-type lysozyme